MSEQQILAGFHAVQARVRHHPESIKTIYYDQKRRDKRMQQLLDRAQSAGLKLQAVPNEFSAGWSNGWRYQSLLYCAEHNSLAVRFPELWEGSAEQPCLLLS